MIYGKSGDDDAVPLDFIAAARLAGVSPPIMRKWLHRPAVVALIRRERAAFRTALCCGNEAALARIRDHCDNAAAAVRATLALEQIDEVDSTHRRGEDVSPRLTIVIQQPAAPAPAVTTIEAEPLPPPVETDDPHDPTQQLRTPRFRDPTDPSR